MADKGPDEEPEGTTSCSVCKIVMPSSQYQLHIKGKKHQGRAEHLNHVQQLEAKGLFIKGIPLEATPDQVKEVFSPYGTVTNVQMFSFGAFLEYADSESREMALRQVHTMKNRVLFVRRRQVRPDPTKCPKKNDKKKQSGDKTKSDQPAVDHVKLMEELSKPLQVSSQLDTLFRFSLAEKDDCEMVKEKVLTDIDSALKFLFPSFKLHAFGSMTTGLAFKDSDLDVYAQVGKGQSICEKDAQGAAVKRAAKCFYKKPTSFSDIVPIKSAKTPIIKLFHIPTRVSCDLNFRDELGCRNSRLLNHYFKMHERFYSLIVFIKYWARTHELSGPNKVSNYALAITVISYLQSLRDDVGNRLLPTVHQLQENGMSEPFYVVGWKCNFDDRPFTVTLPDSEQYSFIGLLKGFFVYLSSFPFDTHVMCLLMGDMVSRDLFQHHPEDLPDAFSCYKIHLSKEPQDELCKPVHEMVIQDPFRLCHNLVGGVLASCKQYLIHACQWGALLCDKALNNQEDEMLILHYLLTTTKLQKHMRTSNLNIFDKDKMSIIMSHPSRPDPSLYEKEYNVLCDIFTRILLLSVTENDKSATKVQKVEEMADVHEGVGKKDFERVLECVGDKEMWIGRNKARKEITLTGGLSLKNEESVTQFLSEKYKHSHPVKFQCRFCPQKDAGKLVLEFQNLHPGKKNEFNALQSFLQVHMGKWMSEFVRQTQVEERQGVNQKSTLKEDTEKCQE